MLFVGELWPLSVENFHYASRPTVVRDEGPGPDESLATTTAALNNYSAAAAAALPVIVPSIGYRASVVSVFRLISCSDSCLHTARVMP